MEAYWQTPAHLKNTFKNYLSVGLQSRFWCSFPIGTFRIYLDFIYIQTSSRVYLDFIQSSPSFDLDLEFLQSLSRVSLFLLSRSRIDLDLIYNSEYFPPKNPLDEFQMKSRKPVARFVVKLQIITRSRQNLDKNQKQINSRSILDMYIDQF